MKKHSDLYDEVVEAPRSLKKSSGVHHHESITKFVKLSQDQLHKKRIRIKLSNEIEAKREQLMKCLEHKPPRVGDENVFEKLNTDARLPQETA